MCGPAQIGSVQFGSVRLRPKPKTEPGALGAASCGFPANWAQGKVLWKWGRMVELARDRAGGALGCLRVQNGLNGLRIYGIFG